MCNFSASAPMIVNAAFLVEKSQVAAFTEKVNALREFLATYPDYPLPEDLR